MHMMCFDAYENSGPALNIWSGSVLEEVWMACKDTNEGRGVTPPGCYSVISACFILVMPS